MKINKLRLKNFRCFEEAEITLHPHYTVLIGINGAGKSTMLDALSIALGGFLTGFDGIASTYIRTDDAHYKMFRSGSKIEPQEQFPVEIYAEGTVQGNTLSWQRELNGLERRTTHGNAKQIVDYARSLQEAVRAGTPCVLPLVAYYGTGRLWLQKQNRRKERETAPRLKRQMGYTDCLSSMSNEKQLLQWFKEMTYIQLQEGHPLPELEAAKSALRQCYLSVSPDVTDAQFYYDVKSSELKVLTERSGGTEEFPVRVLSDGEKGIISLVADISYRMALLNPELPGGVLTTPGVVLIDEIDLHLHPQWQKKIIGDLTTIFPNIQFVFTTHSPSVLANVKREHIQVLNRYQLYQPQTTTYGRTAEDILREIMGIDIRPGEIIQMQGMFDDAIDRGDYTLARETLERMREILGDNAREIVGNQVVLDVEA